LQAAIYLAGGRL